MVSRLSGVEEQVSEFMRNKRFTGFILCLYLPLAGTRR